MARNIKRSIGSKIKQPSATGKGTKKGMPGSKITKPKKGGPGTAIDGGAGGS